MDHRQIWRAIDRLAESRGMSVSALARLAGLDATALNKSKRIQADGRLHWPSTESLAKILEAARCPDVEFFGFMQSAAHNFPSRALPCLTLPEITARHFDETGSPKAKLWEEADFPDLADSSAYMLNVVDNRFAPVFRADSRLVVAPKVSIRKGDRVVALLKGRDVTVLELRQKTMHRIEFSTLSATPEILECASPDVIWMSRIVWASQ